MVSGRVMTALPCRQSGPLSRRPMSVSHVCQSQCGTAVERFSVSWRCRGRHALPTVMIRYSPQCLLTAGKWMTGIGLDAGDGTARSHRISQHHVWLKCLPRELPSRDAKALNTTHLSAVSVTEGCFVLGTQKNSLQCNSSHWHQRKYRQYPDSPEVTSLMDVNAAHRGGKWGFPGEPRVIIAQTAGCGGR